MKLDEEWIDKKVREAGDIDDSSCTTGGFHDAYRVNARKQNVVVRKSRAWDRFRNAAPLRRLVFDAVVAAPATAITMLVILSQPPTPSLPAAAGVVLALLLYAVACVFGILAIGALYDNMDPKVAMRLSILISVYSPLSLFLLVGHWTLTGKWLPAPWREEPSDRT